MRTVCMPASIWPTHVGHQRWVGGGPTRMSGGGTVTPPSPTPPSSLANGDSGSGDWSARLDDDSSQRSCSPSAMMTGMPTAVPFSPSTTWTRRLAEVSPQQPPSAAPSSEPSTAACPHVIVDLDPKQEDEAPIVPRDDGPSQCATTWAAWRRSPLALLHHRQLERALALEVEVAHVQADGRLDPLVDRLGEELAEALGPGGQLLGPLVGEEARQDGGDLRRGHLLPRVEGEARVEHDERHELALVLLIGRQLGR